MKMFLKFNVAQIVEPNLEEQKQGVKSIVFVLSKEINKASGLETTNQVRLKSLVLIDKSFLNKELMVEVQQTIIASSIYKIEKYYKILNIVK